nr:MAG TPA: hypothetical protein [Bacteriophage sp.]
MLGLEKSYNSVSLILASSFSFHLLYLFLAALNRIF